MDKLIIADLQFHSHCGVTETEQEIGQRLSLDIELYCDVRKVSAADSLLEYLDYRHVVDVVLEIGRKDRFKLLESLAERLAQVLIKQFPVEEVVLRLKKMHPPVEAIQGYFGVEIRRKMSDLPKLP
jgi:dihydroneopterin aldolase